jgi:hypothetical protein
VQLADVRPKLFDGPSKILTGSTSLAARTIRLRSSKLIALARSNSSRNSTASALSEARKDTPSILLVGVVEGSGPENLCCLVVEQSRRHGAVIPDSIDELRESSCF